MSREINIRFWDKTTNTMIYPIANYESICIVNGKMKPSLSNSIVDNWNWYKREYEPLEYTGLKDKNGTEIYEGDIIKYTHKVVGSIVREVVYKSGAFGIEGTVKGTHIIFGNILESEREVIGNIYKNPELLKED